jgi:hypothetical protein
MVKRLSRIPRTNVEFPDEVMAAFMQALKGRDHRESLIRSIYGDPRYWQAVDAVMKKKGRAA